MKSTDELFQLISSLTAAEKRVFTLHARRYAEEPHYLDLFEALDNMQTYDKRAVLAKFAGTTVARHYAVVRHQLLSEILSCLHRMPAERDATSTLRAEMDAVNFLLSRGCTVTAERRMRRALALAQDNELPATVVDICAMQRRGIGSDSRGAVRIFKDEHAAIHAMHDLHAASRMLDAATRNYAEFLLGNDVCDHAEPLELRADETLSRIARLRRERARWHVALMRSGWEQARLHVQVALQIVLECCTIADPHIADVSDALSDAAEEAMLNGDVAIVDAARDVLATIAASEHTSASSRRILDLVDTHIVVGKAVHCCGDLNDAEVLLMRRDEDALRQLPRKALFTWNLRAAALALVNDDAITALERVNELIANTAVRAISPKWYGQALLLNAAIHLALGNVKYIPFCVRGTLRKTERRLLLTKHECGFVRSIHQASINGKPLQHFVGPMARIITVWQHQASTLVMHGSTPSHHQRAA